MLSPIGEEMVKTPTQRKPPIPSIAAAMAWTLVMEEGSIPDLNEEEKHP